MSTKTLNAYCLYHFGMDNIPIKAFQNPQRVLSLSFWNEPITNKSLPEPATCIVFIILEWTIYQLKPIRTLNVYCLYHFGMDNLPIKAYQNPQRVLSLSFWNGPITNKSLPEPTTHIVFITLEWTIYQQKPTRTLNAYRLYHFGMDNLLIKAYQNSQRMLSLSSWNGQFTN